MAEATPATPVPNARLSGVKITKEAMEVWAEALDAWLHQLAQEIVQEHTSQALTPANVQASLQLLLAKGSRVAHQGRNSRCHAARLDNAYQAALSVRSFVNINCTPLHTAADTLEVWYTGNDIYGS
ncbi:hypothetical protein ABBQ32_004184 [Trebouxia sp. C0010 RCD-2024]